MKKIIALIVILTSVHTLQAQFYAEFNGQYLFESITSEQVIENPTSAGLEVSTGYFFTKKVSAGLSFGKYWYKPFSNSLNLSFHDIKSSVYYDFLSNKSITLYGGIGIGYFWEKLDADNIILYQDEEEISDNKDSYFGWLPTAGVRIPIGSEKFILDLSVSHYFYPEKPGRINRWYNLKAGLRYQW